MKLFTTLFILGLWASVASAAVEGNLYQWQIDNYDWSKKEFKDVIEKDLLPEEDLKGKTADELYQWQLKDHDWIKEEFDMEGKGAR
jgi:hypothetical protein